MRKTDKNIIGMSNLVSKEEEIILQKKNILFEKIKSIDDIPNINTLLSSRQEISRILYYDQIYKNLLNKPGTIMEFGVQYGSALALLCKLRGIYEPYNYSRKIIGFDTFDGFQKDMDKEEKKFGWKKGDYSVPKNYQQVLEELLTLEEMSSPIAHIKKFELIKGDASKTIITYLKKNPETVIGMAIFDMDLYKPTKDVLQAIKNRLFKGSVLVFDETNHPEFPGQTKAILETIGLKNLKLNSFHGATYCSWAILD